MFAHIEGEILLLEGNSAIVTTMGVGYQVLLSKRDYETLIVGQKIKLHLYTHVREDALELYGFSEHIYKQLFLLLISVSGIGPKLALVILSSLSPHDLLDAITHKDIALLSSIPGIGKKTAERLSLELTDKALKLSLAETTITPTTNSTRHHLEQAIKSLGYSKTQSDKAILGLDQGDLATLPLEDLIKKTLNVIMRK